MAFKKIKLEETDCCPSCYGQSGIEFYGKSHSLYINDWKSTREKAVFDSVKPVNGDIKTAKCRDCGKRFEIVR